MVVGAIGVSIILFGGVAAIAIALRLNCPELAKALGAALLTFLLLLWAASK